MPTRIKQPDISIESSPRFAIMNLRLFTFWTVSRKMQVLTASRSSIYAIELFMAAITPSLRSFRRNLIITSRRCLTSLLCECLPTLPCITLIELSSGQAQWCCSVCHQCMPQSVTACTIDRIFRHRISQGPAPPCLDLCYRSENRARTWSEEVWLPRIELQVSILGRCICVLIVEISDAFIRRMVANHLHKVHPSP